jgi:hypothetical protein
MFAIVFLPLVVAAALLLVQERPGFAALTGPSGQVIYVNPATVTSIREPRTVYRGHFVAGTQCILVMVNSNFIAVPETCDEVYRKLMIAAGR